MTAFVKKYGKYIAILIVIGILASGIPMFVNGFKINQVKAEDNDNENRIAADISNMTGVDIEEIKKLRSSGRTWNEVLEKVKSTSLYKKDSADRREEVLAKDGIGEDYMEKLEKEGFSKDEITEARLLVERVIYELKEITSESETTELAPKVDISLSNEKKDEKEALEACSNLSSKLDTKTAIYLMLKLKKDFGSIDKVLDEYLLSIQLEINLEEYLIDKKNYEKQKSDKSALTLKTAITLAKIEDMVLKKVQDDNKANNSKSNDINPVAGITDPAKKAENKSPLPEVPLPDTKDVKPQNPANEIMKEIQTIDPMRNGGK